MVAHTSNLSIQEVETEGLLVYEAILGYTVKSQPVLQEKTV